MRIAEPTDNEQEFLNNKLIESRSRNLRHPNIAETREDELTIRARLFPQEAAEVWLE